VIFLGLEVGMTKEILVTLIVAYSKLFGVDPDIAVAVATVESGFNVEATGQLGEIGLFQIRPEFYPMLGAAEIRVPRTNIMLGVKKLANYQKTCVHKDDLTFLVCYNYGPENAKKVRYPDLFPYVVKINLFQS